MIRREADAALINRISNLPGVRENICYKDGPMDWSDAFPARRTGVVVLSNGKDACAAFAMTGEREWQSHTMFAPTCRGRDAIEAGRSMVKYMRPHADRLWGATPMNNPAARWFNRQLGAKPVCRDRYEVEGDVELFEIRMAD